MSASVERLLGLVELEGLHRRGKRAAEPGMRAGRAERVDDLAVEVRADQPDVMPVVGQRHGERRAHDPGAEDCDSAHAFSFSPRRTRRAGRGPHRTGSALSDLALDGRGTPCRLGMM